jgi:hypothetical protein
VRAALLGNEESGDLALHPCRDQHRTGLGQRLHARRDIRHVAVNLAARVEHGRADVEPDTGGKLRPAGTGILAIQLGERALDRKRSARSSFGVVLVRDRIPE